MTGLLTVISIIVTPTVIARKNESLFVHSSSIVPKLTSHFSTTEYHSEPPLIDDDDDDDDDNIDCSPCTRLACRYGCHLWLQYLRRCQLHLSQFPRCRDLRLRRGEQTGKETLSTASARGGRPDNLQSHLLLDSHSNGCYGTLQMCQHRG
jgi:hypothetical protein